MRVLFFGPSLYGIEVDALSGLHCRGPARQGDVLQAVLDGATTIGLVDGLYGDVASIWHKEILFALEQGVTVVGAASLGALRAAECAPFGMIGIGEIYGRYAAGDLEDDDAVAQLHAPAELGYQPLTEALVNIEATLAEIKRKGLLDTETCVRLWDTATRLFFAERTYEVIVEGVFQKNPHSILDLILENRVDLKRSDAMALIKYIVNSSESSQLVSWHLSGTRTWDQVLSHHRRNQTSRPVTFV